MRIMFLIFSFNTGGIERQLIEMSKVMIRRGEEVSLCVINDDYSADLLEQVPKEVRTYFLGRTPGSKTTWKGMGQLSELIARTNTQILHCQGANCVLYAARAKIEHPGLVILNTVHTCGNYPSYSRAKIFALNRLCSMTIGISHTVEKEILSRKVPKNRVTMIYNAIDTKRFPLRGTRTFGEDGVIKIGCVARLYPAQKGQDTLVSAVLKLLPDFPQLHCSFAGDVFKGQEEAVKALKDQIHEAGADGNFTFIGNVADVPGFLSGLDVFVMPSHSEAFGNALIEAMSCGLCCIASHLAGPEEILKNPTLGLLFEPGDAEDLADKIRQMIRDHADYDPQKISAYVRENFDIEQMVDRHLALYQSLLKD